MEKAKEDSDESFSIKTTRTLREKGKLVGRCVINMLKFWRIYCGKKRHKLCSKKHIIKSRVFKKPHNVAHGIRKPGWTLRLR